MTGYANVWIELLEASSPKWNDRYDRYKNSGIEKEDMNALNHEMDHFNTWKAFYSFVKSLNSYDGKVFPGDCDLRAKTINERLAQYKSQAEAHSDKFDQKGWNQGGQYGKHPFDTSKFSWEP